jgi:hypothetical protein
LSLRTLVRTQQMSGRLRTATYHACACQIRAARTFGSDITSRFHRNMSLHAAAVWSTSSCNIDAEISLLLRSHRSVPGGKQLWTNNLASTPIG